jgi:hypothetical protein
MDQLQPLGAGDGLEDVRLETIDFVRLTQHDSNLRAGRVFHRHGDGLGLLS